MLRKDDVKLRVQGKTWKEDCQARKLNKEDAVEGRRRSECAATGQPCPPGGHRAGAFKRT